MSTDPFFRTIIPSVIARPAKQVVAISCNFAIDCLNVNRDCFACNAI